MFPLFVLALSFSAESVKQEIFSCDVSSIFDFSEIHEYLLKTTDKNAQIEINGVIGVTKGEMTQEVDTSLARTITVPIKVTAEDTTIVKEYTLTINLVSDIKDLEYVKVNDIVVTDYDSESYTYRAFIPADSTSAKVDIKTLSEYATIKIDSTEAVGQLSYTATIEDDITNVYVDVVAEDDSVRTYTVVLQKISTDSELKELYKDNVFVDPEDDDSYIINVSEDTTQVTLKAVANNQYASVAIGTEAAELAQSQKVVVLDSGKTTTLNILVTAQDGTSSTYPVTINKLSANNQIEYVKVNSDDITTSYNRETKTFSTFIPADSTTATVDIKAKSEYATVESGDITGTQLISIDATTDAEQTTLEVIVTAENGLSETYYVVLTKISTDNTIKSIYVDNKLIESDGEGKYIAEVIETNTESLVKVVASNEYANVQIGGNEIELAQSEKTVVLSKEKYTEVLITVTSQNGEVLQETLTIKKVSDDASINTVFVNSIECTNYDETTKTYTAYIDESEDVTSVAVFASSNYATVVVDTTSGVGNVTTNVDTTNEITTAQISIKSETGKVEKYSLKIVKKSADATAGIIKVNDIEITEPYEVEIKKLDTKVKIYVKASNDKATVKIADEEAELAESTAILDIETGIDNIVVPVIITAQNGKDKLTYNITLKRLSNETGIKEILVNDEFVDLSTFEHIVKNVESVDVKVTTVNEEAKVCIDNGSESVNVATATIATPLTTVRTIKVTAPDGTVKEYSLTLIKKTTITGKITDANIVSEHYATITVYQTNDTRAEGALNNPREVIQSVQTNADGTYEIVLEPGTYDVVFTKPGYLTHRITKIDITDGLGAELDVVNLIGGDIDQTGEIEIDDLVLMNDNYCTITEDNKADKEKFDLNGDGVVNSLDRTILKANYHKKSETVEWVDPDAVATTYTVSAMSLDEDLESAESINVNSNGYILPMACDYRISSNYGYRVHPVSGETKLHSGIDIVGTWHTEILAVADGEITYAGVQNGYGNCIEIKHIVNGETIYTFYAHLSEIKVSVGDRVSQGQVIALEGGDASDPNPGTSTGHHLHLEFRSASGSGHSLDPNNYIDF